MADRVNITLVFEYSKQEGQCIICQDETLREYFLKGDGRAGFLHSHQLSRMSFFSACIRVHLSAAGNSAEENNPRRQPRSPSACQDNQWSEEIRQHYRNQLQLDIESFIL